VAEDLESVATPALVVDRKVLLENIEAMAARASAAGVGLRPMAKTHKSPAIGRLQLEAGAVGLTVATLREAEVFAAAGFEDLLIASPPIGEWRVQRLVELATRVRLRVTVDSHAAVQQLDEACRRSGVEVGYLWEVDCGVGRFGTAPGEPSAAAIARSAGASTHCRFDGLLAFGGHAYAASGPDEIALAAQDERNAVTGTAAALTALGIDAEVRSIGTTPTAHFLADADGITELRPGNYAFYDATQVALGLVGQQRCALTVLATVVSRPSATRVILDSGSKAMAAERPSPLTVGFGLVRGHPELRVERLFEEQAIAVADEACELPVGARVHVVPNHACAAANLHRRILVVEDGAVVDAWPVDARGWSPQ
jgi:D-serine deaminase-like pyridoxal phosphate-dependent protein